MKTTINKENINLFKNIMIEDFNKRLQVKSVKGLKFRISDKIVCELHKGYGFYIEGKGFVRFDNDKLPIPYTPAGGRKTVKEVIEQGGFLTYNGMSFVNPIN